MQDLIRGIKKLTEKEEPKPVVVNETKVVTNVVNNGAEQLLKRAKLALEDGEFEKADEFCEQALNIDAENAEAYLNKLLAEFKVTSIEKLGDLLLPFSDSKNYQKFIRFGDEVTKNKIQYSLDEIKERIKHFAKNDYRLRRNMLWVNVFLLISAVFITMFLQTNYFFYIGCGFIILMIWFYGIFIQLKELIKKSKLPFNVKERDKFYKDLGIIDENGNIIE